MYFDLSSMKRESIRLIIDLCLAVVIGAALFSVLVFVLVRRMLVVPLRDVTRRVEQIEPGKELVPMPDFQSPEMTDLARAIEKACRAQGRVIP
jgi:nitrate/nitrite-specific signal transduction histidine kinase